MIAPPPPPHDPRERERVAVTGAWEVRQFPADDPKLAYFAPRGFLHVQLWHPGEGVSVLTPSKLTGGLYAIWSPDARLDCAGWDDVVCALPRLIVPGAAQVRAFERWLVTAHEPRHVHLLRHVWRHTRRRQEA